MLMISFEMSNIDLIKEGFKFLGQHQDMLTEFQVNFITGLSKYFKKHKTLTEKQSAVLHEIVKLTSQKLEAYHKKEHLTTT